MNKLKRTLAMVATLAISATAFVGCGDDSSSSTTSTSSPADNSSSTADAATEAPAAEATEAPAEDAPADDAAGSATSIDKNAPYEFTYAGSLADGGDAKMTILAWNANDVPPMYEMWCESTGKNPEEVINFVNFDCGGGDAAANYDQYFLSGDDCDIFMVEADWALRYINDAEATLALSELGFTDASFAGQYGYTMEIGKDSNGVIKGVSWQAAPGAWCYRSDLADTYLGVKSPEEMQAKVGDWDAFQATAAEVSTASGGKTALTTTLGGIWQVYAASRTTPWVVDGVLAVDDYCNNFIELAKNMRDNGYVTELAQWNPDWYAAGQTDDTMGYFVSTWGFGDAILLQAAGGDGGATFGKWACTEGPTPYFWGGTWMCVSPKTNNAEMVANFINYHTVNESSMKHYALDKEGGEYVNNMNVMQNIVDEKSNSNANLGGQDQFAVVHANAKAIDLKGLITPYDSAIKSAFLDAVNAYCNGDVASAEECIETFKDNVSTNVTDVVVE